MTTALLFLSFLLFAFTPNAAVPVLDINGDPLLPGGQYYVLPHIWGPTGGGLYPGKTGNQTCPVSVLQSPFEVDNGKPLVFTPLLDIGIVLTNSALDIAFAESPDCAESGKWLLVDDLNGEYWSVGIGGNQDHQGYQTLTGFFKIHKYGSYAYRFSFLPFVNAPMSGYIGKTRDRDGNIRLVVKGEESFYGVVFAKATSEVSKM